MDSYDPQVAPNPDDWNDLDELERLALIQDFHQEVETELPNPRLHAAIHMVVENQAALGEETPVRETIARLMTEGLHRHDAIHAVGSVLAGHIHGIMTGQSDAEFPEEEYFDELRQLTAAGWKASFEE